MCISVPGHFHFMGSNQERFRQLLQRPDGVVEQQPLFAHLLCEFFCHYRRRHQRYDAVESALRAIGHDVGQRLWEVFLIREHERTGRAALQPEPQYKKLLERIRDRFWRFLFAHALGPPEIITSSGENVAAQRDFRLRDKRPATDACVSFPQHYCSSLPAALLAGVIQAALDACRQPAKVTLEMPDPALGEVLFTVRFLPPPERRAAPK